jgi:hypothetical protein
VSTWDVTVNTTQLNTLGSGVRKVSGIGGIAGRTNYNASAYGFDGESSDIGGLVAGACTLTVWVDDHDRSTGVQPDSLEDRQAVAWNNLQWLQGLFMSDYKLTVAVQVPGLSTLTDIQRTRVALCQLFTMSVPEDELENGTRWSVVIGLKVPDVYWRVPAGGSDLDADGYRTVNYGAGTFKFTLPQDVYPMTGAIEDAIFVIKNGPNPLKAVQVQALNRNGSAAGYPTMLFSTPRTSGLLGANGQLVVDCRKHTALATVGTTTENVFKFDGSYGGQAGSILRILPPYQLQVTLTPVTAGAAVTAAAVSVKYRPSFI